jgi:hypothetical protein
MTAYTCYIAVPAYNSPKYLSLHSIPLRLPLPLSRRQHRTFQGLSFTSRSLTHTLAQPATANLGGDLNLVAVLCIASGILIVLFGPTILKWMKIPEGTEAYLVFRSLLSTGKWINQLVKRKPQHLRSAR